MTANEFENLKSRIKDIELNNAKVSGQIELIKENWKKNYGIETLEDAEKKLSEIKSENETKIAKKNSLMDKLESMMRGI